MAGALDPRMLAFVAANHRGVLATLEPDGRPQLFDLFYAYDAHDPLVRFPVAADPDDATVDELVAYYRATSGEHDDWAEYRAAMVADRRLVVRLRPEHTYGQLPA